MPCKTFAAQGAICLALVCRGDDAGVIVQRPDQWMRFEKRQRLLFRSAPFQELTNRAQAKSPVREGDFAGHFQGLAVVPLGQAD